MIYHFVRFLFHVVLSYLRPSSIQGELPIESHAHLRRQGKPYKRKQALVKNIWICSGVVMCAFPFPAFVTFSAIFTTFLSFCILDETE